VAADSYREHFVASNQTHRELAIAAYRAAEPTARRSSTALATTMNAMLLAPGSAEAQLSDRVAGAFRPRGGGAGQAAGCARKARSSTAPMRRRRLPASAAPRTRSTPDES